METSGTWGLSNGYGLNISWSLCTSATNQFATSTVNQWIIAPTPSAKYHNIGNLNLFDTSGATWRIAQIQLEEGPVPGPFQFAGKTITGELALCQRYYHTGSTYGVGDATNGNIVGFYSRYPVAMRANPTATWTSDFISVNGGGSAAINGVSMSAGTESVASAANGVGGIAGRGYQATYKADAEL
jgi:hypothetical protein